MTEVTQHEQASKGTTAVKATKRGGQQINKSNKHRSKLKKTE